MADSNEMTLSLFESRFKNRQYIGSGGFAKVYKAFDHAKNHYVALKVADVRPEWKQFTLQREVELVNKLSPHPNIARYDACYRFDMGVAGEIDFAILKFYEDGNLDQFITKQALSPDDLQIIVKGILRGVSFLHINNYVHRDLKSQNILLQREDGVWTPKITDFGLSRSMGAESTANNSAIAVSYSYAAPEQIQNRRIYKNVDIWAVGVIIYKMVTGELPFKTDMRRDGRDTQSQLELSRRIVNAELPERLDSIQEPYQSIIRRCLVADPQVRCQNAEELLNLLDGEPTPMGNYHEEEEERLANMHSPTLFVPVEPEPAPPQEEKTVLMDVEALAEKEALGQTVVLPPPPPSPLPPPPPPVQERQYNSYPGYTSPSPSYEEPKPDYTQIIEPQRVSAPEIPIPVTSGDPESRFKWWHGLLLLLLLGGALLAFYFFFQQQGTYLPGRNEKLYRYNEIRQDNEKAYGDETALKAVEDNIEKVRKFDNNNYLWPYELAKSRASLGKDAEALENLRNAAKLAIDDPDNARELLRKLSKDESNVFKQLVSSTNSDKWKRLVTALQKLDKGYLADL